MDKIQYIDPAEVSDVKETDPPVNRSITGYGNRIPTAWMLKIAGRWRRVYAICYSNAASYYVRMRAERLFLGGFDPPDRVRPIQARGTGSRATGDRRAARVA